MASLTEEITNARNVLGIKDYRLPTGVSKQKNLLAHLQEKIERKQKAEQRKAQAGNVKEPAPRLLEEPPNRREFVRRVREYQDMCECDLTSAIRAVSEDVNVRPPSVKTYILWDSIENITDNEGVKVLPPDMHLPPPVVAEKPQPPINGSPMTTPTLKALQATEYAAFVEMVWEHAHTTNVGLEEAAKLVGERLGVYVPPVQTLYNWRIRYNVTTPVLRRGIRVPAKKASAPSTQQTKPPTVTSPSSGEATILAIIEAADSEVLDKLEERILARKSIVRQQREQEIAKLDEEIKKLQEKRAALTK